MKKRIVVDMLAVFWLSLCIVACGGSSTAGISGTGGPEESTSIGTIDGFGSVIVNGERFDTSNAEFLVNGAPAAQDDLSVGQVIRVVGKVLDNGARTADQVIFVADFQGPISSIDSVTQSFVVLGQQIFVDENTQFLGVGSFTSLTSGQSVVVSGLFTREGLFRATFINTKAVETLKIVGIVGTLNLAENQVQIGGQNYVLNEGVTDLVEGLTYRFAIAPGADQLAINAAERYDLFEDITTALIEVEGFSDKEIGGFFDVVRLNGLDFIIDDETVFENGTIDDIGLNSRVEVLGERQEETDLLFARRIRIIQTETVEVSGLLMAGDTTTIDIPIKPIDKALWVWVRTVEGQVGMTLTTNDRSAPGYHACDHFLVNESGVLCYVDTEQNETWTVNLIARFNQDVEYEVSYFTRRATFDPAQSIVADSETQVTVSPGDRKYFQIANDPTSDEYFHFVADGATSGDGFYISADQVPTNQSFDCRFRTDPWEERGCRLRGEGVETWYILVEAAQGGQYSLANLKKPSVKVDRLTTLEQVLDANDAKFGVIYEMPLTASDLTFAAEIRDIAWSSEREGDPIQFNQIDLRTATLRDDQKGVSGWRCFGEQAFANSERCITPYYNETVGYAVVTGQEGTQYSIAFASDLTEPTEQSLEYGTPYSGQLERGERQIFKLPGVPEGEVFTTFTENASDFVNVSFTPDPNILALNPNLRRCNGAPPGFDICRQVAPVGWDDIYVVVESVLPANFDLITARTQFETLDIGNKKTLFIEASEAKVGKLIRLVADNEGQTLVVTLSDMSANVDLIMDPIEPSSLNLSLCTSKNPGFTDDQCRLTETSYNNNTWYILVTGESGTTFSVEANLE